MRGRGKQKSTAEIPFNQDAEEAVVGTIISNHEALRQANKILEPEDFFITEAAAVFEVCISLYDGRQEVNQQAITRELKAREVLDDIGGSDYVAKLIEVSDAVAFSSNASIVKNLSVVRRLICLYSKGLKDGVAPDADAIVMLQDLEAELGELKAKAKGIGPRIVKLEILTSNPRKYGIKFSNGEIVGISVEQIMNPKAVEQAIINKLDFVPALAKDWRKFIRRLMTNAEKSLAPPGADVTIEVLDTIRDLFEARGEGKAASDLRSGSYALEEINGERYYLFQKSAPLNYIKQQLNRSINTADLWQLVYSWGGIDQKDGKPITKCIGNDSRTALWGLPAKVIEQGIVEKRDEIELLPDGQPDVSFLGGQDA